MKEDAVPPGWSYDPAAWSQRLPLVSIAFLGFCIALYLAAYQLKWIGNVWEPFFGNGTKIILNSPISRVLPVPDAALGALGYMLDIVSGVIGSPLRWRTMPWIVLLFGFAIGPLGAISVLLVILQPVLYDAWCTLCLLSALLSIVMIGPAMDEVLASLQYLKRVHDEGGSVWKAFWGKTK